ncbi:MAG: carbohydrate kinase [Terriglobales bacterium]
MGLKIVGIGEVLWDLLLTGPQLGGAPANFAYHAHALGAQVQVITRVGDDEYGREVSRRFRNMGLPDATVQLDKTAPTGTAKVVLSGDGLAHFTVQENVAWDSIAATKEALAAASAADAVCFGTVAQRCQTSRETIQRLVAATPPRALRVADINLRKPFYSRAVIEESLRLANVLKLNDDELAILAGMFGVGGSAENQIEYLAQAFDLHVVALTRGPQGSLLFERKRKRWSDCSSHPVQVIDTVGAGDSFTAALVLGLLQKMDLDEISEIANEVARYVCSERGATPSLPIELARRFMASSPQ